MRLSISPAVLVGALSAAFSMLLWLSAAGADPTTEYGQYRLLQPGDNPIGWVGAQTTPDTLLAQIPSAVLIYAWDAERATYLFDTPALSGTLRVIQPGMGFIVRIASVEPVTWRQPTTGVGQRISLHPGPNLVAWTSYSGAPIDVAVRDIGDAFTSALHWNWKSGAYRSHPGTEHGSQRSLELTHGDALWVFVSGTTLWPQAELGRPLHLVTLPPSDIQWSDSFDKHLDSDGVSILANEEVPDEALFRAAEVIDNMLINRPELRAAMVEHRYQIVIVGDNERTYSLAPYSQLEGHYPEVYERQGGPRGLGGSRYSPTLFPEEGLLCLEADTYGDYSVSVHEFAHTIANVIVVLTVAADSQSDFSDQLFDAYKQAQASPYWNGSYAISNSSEFWAEIVTIWMGVYGRALGQPPAPDARVRSREGLAELAPYAAELIVSTLGDVQFTASCKSLRHAS